MNYHRNSEIRLPKLELGVRSASLLLCVLYLYVCQMSLMRQWFQFTCLSVRSRLTRARLTHDTSFTLLFHRKLLTFGSPTVIELVSRGKCDRKHTHTKTNREIRTNETNMKRKKKPFQLFSIGLTKLAVVFWDASLDHFIWLSSEAAFVSLLVETMQEFHRFFFFRFEFNQLICFSYRREKRRWANKNERNWSSKCERNNEMMTNLI